WVGLEAELEAVDFTGIAARLGVGGSRDGERGQRSEHVVRAKAPSTAYVGVDNLSCRARERRRGGHGARRRCVTSQVVPGAFAHITHHFFIGSHCLVSLPQKSMQSS